MPCWPDEPHYDQLRNGAKLRKHTASFEAADLDTPGNTPFVLREGVEFDDVVLSIGMGALPAICRDLADRHRQWRDMLDHVRTIATVGVQIWSGRGRRGKIPLMMSSDRGPFGGYGDMSHLIPREMWPADQIPQHLLHACNRLEDDEIPGGDRATARQKAIDRSLTKRVRGWLEREGERAVPGFGDGDNPNWEVLSDPSDGQGAQRLAAQYWRINAEPTDRFVLTVPGSTRYRLASDGSGVDNLFLAGTWTKNGLDIGSVESAAVSGMQAARAISGRPVSIPGEHDMRD